MQKYKDERGKQTDRQTQQLPVTLPVTGDEVIHIHNKTQTEEPVWTMDCEWQMRGRRKQGMRENAAGESVNLPAAAVRIVCVWCCVKRLRRQQLQAKMAIPRRKERRERESQE